MGIWAKLFGGSQGIKTSKNFQCAICGKALHGGSGGSVSGSYEQVSSYMASKAQYCPNCQNVYCLNCCLQSAAQKGKSSMWECPNCGKEFPR